MTQQAIQRSLAALFATFGSEPTADLLRGYVMGVGDLEPGRLQEAVFRAIRECDHLPRPAELLKLAGENSDPESLAIAAWGDVLRAVPYGSWKSIAFEDITINAAIRLMGGWPTMIERFSDADSEKWARIEFMRAYKSLVSRGVDGEACRPLMGLSEKQALNGEIVDPVPVLIGCEQSRARIAAPQSKRGPEIITTAKAIAL